MRAFATLSLLLIPLQALGALAPPKHVPDVECITAPLHPTSEARYGDYDVSATSGGLVFTHRYDGSQFVWTACDGLPATAIEAVIDNRQGGLYIAPRGRGLWSLQPTTGELRQVSASQRLDWTTALSWFDGSLWAGTLRHGLLRLEINDESINVTRPVWRFRKGRVSGLSPSRDGRLLVARDMSGLWALSRDRRSVRVLKGSVQGLLQDPTGQIWVNRGVTQCRLEGKRCLQEEPLYRLARPEALTDAHFTSLEVHRDGSNDPALVAATFASGLVVRSGDGRWRKPDHDGEAPRFINTLKRHEGVLWAGTARGLFRLDETGWTRFGEAQGLPSDHVNSVAFDEAGAMWVGTSRGVAHWDERGIATFGPRDGLPYPIVYSVDAAQGMVAVGTAYGFALKDQGGWRHYRVGHGGLSDDWVNATSISPEGEVFIGTYDAGVDRLHAGQAQETQGLESVWVNPNGLFSLKGIPGTLVATLGDGLWLRQPDGETCRLDRRLPLPSVDVTDAVIFGEALWISTRAGLARWPLNILTGCGES